MPRRGCESSDVSMLKFAIGANCQYETRVSGVLKRINYKREALGRNAGITLLWCAMDIQDIIGCDVLIDERKNIPTEYSLLALF